MKTFKDTKYGDLTGKVYESNINVSMEDLDSLKSAPKIVKGYFSCGFNNLTSLEGSPKEVNSHFVCSHNGLENLEYAPEIVNGKFDCTYNKKLETLEGAPKLVIGNFNCTECQKLKSLDELLDTEISGKLFSDIMTDKEFRELQELYKKANKNIKKYELLKKLKGLK